MCHAGAVGGPTTNFVGASKRSNIQVEKGEYFGYHLPKLVLLQGLRTRGKLLSGSTNLFAGEGLRTRQ